MAASRKLAARLNAARGADADPTNTVNAGALFAMGMIDELNHALAAQYRKEVDPDVLAEALRWFALKDFTKLGTNECNCALWAFCGDVRL